MATKVIKTAGQVAYEDFHEKAGVLNAVFHNSAYADAWEAFASKHNIQPITEEVADKPTDGELMAKAWIVSNYNGEKAAAEFLRLRAERDGTGEPLPVTVADYNKWISEHDRQADHTWITYVVDRINQHRGVRPVPQVTAEMLEQVLRRETLVGAAESLNAELAKSATAQPVTPMKVSNACLVGGVLHTFETDDDGEAFRDANDFSWATYVDGHEHHPRKDGTP